MTSDNLAIPESPEPSGPDLVAIERDIDVFERAKDAATEGVWEIDQEGSLYVVTEDEDVAGCMTEGDAVFIVLAHETPLIDHCCNLIAEVRRLRRIVEWPGTGEVAS